jgi:hypothetical protein
MNNALRDEDLIETMEFRKRLNLENVQENQKREKKRREFKKISIIEKQSMAV